MTAPRPRLAFVSPSFLTSGVGLEPTMVKDAPGAARRNLGMTLETNQSTASILGR